MTYVVKATFEKVKDYKVDQFMGKVYNERVLFVAYSDGSWERIAIKGFNIRRGIYRYNENDSEEVMRMKNHYRLENYIQPCNMVKGKMEKEKVHNYIRTREENWNNY